MDVPTTSTMNKTHLSPRLSTSPVRMGSLSPSSIPSSPTSVKSSSSAIFERDIEQIGSPTHAQHNPHRIPRAKNTELSVPSVLDSAAAILTEDGGNDVDVELVSRSPLGSRSPSPRTSLLLGSPAISIMSSSLSPPANKPGFTHDDPPTPTSAYYSMQSSPATATRELPPSSPALSSHAPLSNHNKRLSFVSYSDLLASTPLSTVPLTSLTSEPAEPPHLMETGGVQTPVYDEWEREGLGMGLEERLAALAASSPSSGHRTRPNTRPSSFISQF
ncbi:hypothetical protein CPB85DRAFT_1296273 [Mucidula mucida]|nr:hypothetical protein CPB85DRAFT_1296273 [Mucidula mucida]